MVFGFDDAVGRGAFAGDVAGFVLAGVVLRGGGGSGRGVGNWRMGKGKEEEDEGGKTYRSTSSPLSFSMIAVGLWV